MEIEGHSLRAASCVDGGKRRVCYYYDPGIANVDYGEGHVMVPRRVAMTHALVASYGLLHDMKRLRTRPATDHDLRAFHDASYVEHLSSVNDPVRATDDRAFGVGADNGRNDEEDEYDNPAMDGLWDYCLSYAGGSLAAARALAVGASDVAINWSGGMHHACRDKASGFCYVNDIVLAIQKLLARFRRVLYVDIDVHHGDGVEHHFRRDRRVMTVSFHRYDGAFFPMTGKADDVGEGEGMYHALNVPMKAGMDDDSYLHGLFRPIMDRVMELFAPEAVVLQCGADSLSGDKLGGFHLSVKGHAACVGFLRSFNVPLLMLGGGGYTINHVASCWCYETAVAVGKEKEIPDDIPYHGYEHYYKDQGYKLHYAVEIKKNGRKDVASGVEKIKQDALRNLSMLRPPTTMLLQEPAARGRGSINVKKARALYYDDSYSNSKRNREEDDPIERLHRLCGVEDLKDFFTGIGRRKKLGLGQL